MSKKEIKYQLDPKKLIKTKSVSSFELPTLSLYIKRVMKIKFYYFSLKTIWLLSKSIKTSDFS